MCAEANYPRLRLPQLLRAGMATSELDMAMQLADKGKQDMGQPHVQQGSPWAALQGRLSKACSQCKADRYHQVKRCRQIEQCFCSCLRGT